MQTALTVKSKVKDNFLKREDKDMHRRNKKTQIIAAVIVIVLIAAMLLTTILSAVL